MKPSLRTVPAFALLATLGMLPCAQAGQPTTIPVAACGLEFDLPVGYKTTRPKRMELAPHGRLCAINIVKARPDPVQQGECKDKEDGGQPPYNVCDWVINIGTPGPSVQVVRIWPGGSPLLDAFMREEDGRWMVSNAQAGAQPAEATTFCGKPAWKGETTVRMGWSRQRVKNYTGIYAGSGGADVTLVQFAPDLFVQLQNPPIDEKGEFSVFCASLKLGTRAQDLP